ncbi:MAG: M15 family metallopeptidase [Gammaproteobacteria bacterium]|nr:M15 family metallopeptidase [Gammaproteobacteria bacterium]MBU1553326.1 M15 family metallopeptidase [Gammaproteobacteria bacterium]MBU2070770.1 M15 family metallopeptidase [Gammaproteobacteria bacterium]MBU2182761.1 M15 family metallopeptidase [Gammaproteobacteria bacterium]MBU2205997.1 M15 family metallopeptidase [Gammaproteobacteria bacterium]
MKTTTLAVTLLLSANVAASDIPADFSDVGQLIPDAQINMAYLGSDNFVGSQVDGYQANKCYLQQNAAQALLKVQQAAMAKGYSLWIFDCYRPQRAVNHFMRWAADLADTRTKAQYYPNLAKDKLVGEYIAEKSGHSRGSTIDLTLAVKDEQGNWQPIDMGSKFDMFDPVSNVGAAGISNQQTANRQLLESLMLQAGFKVYNMEWWHFTHQPPVYTDQYFDFVVK